MFNLLPLLFRGSSRPEYAAAQASFESGGLHWEFGASARLLAVLIVARFTFNALLRGPTRRLSLARSAGSSTGGSSSTPVDAEMQAKRLLEEMWVTLGNSVMLAAATFVMMRRNGGCWFLDTSACLTGWPDLPADPAVNLYYHMELAWYLHMLLKPVLRYGLPDGRDMLIHHAATLALILISLGTNLTRMGVVVLALFAVSNPLLHLAKICNQLSLGPLKIGGFVLFAATFFVSRVLLVPWAVLRVTALETRRQIPYAVEDFHTIYLVLNVLLAALYAMQLLWMKGILRVLRSAVSHGSDAASRMSAKIDPAKRYAEAAEPAGPAGQGAQHSGRNGDAAAKSAGKRDGTAGNLPSVPVPVPAPGKQRGGKGGSKGQDGLPRTPSPEDQPALAPPHHQQSAGAALAASSRKK